MRRLVTATLLLAGSGSPARPALVGESFPFTDARYAAAGRRPRSGFGDWEGLRFWATADERVMIARRFHRGRRIARTMIHGRDAFEILGKRRARRRR